MAGTAGAGGGGFNGSGSSSAVGRPCGHDEAELSAAAAHLAAAHEEVDGAKAAMARAEAVEWEGPAASAFRASTASVAAQLAAIAAGLAALAVIAGALQAEADACTGSSSSFGSAGHGSPAPRGLVPDGRDHALLPLPSRTPALRLPGPTGPVFARGLTDSGTSTGAGDGPEAACR